MRARMRVARKESMGDGDESTYSTKTFVCNQESWVGEKESPATIEVCIKCITMAAEKS